MDDCHHQWHSAADEYHHPGHFRRELNTLIQSLRNVTFILQSEKNAIKDFDAWYGPWQEKMRSDPIMRWVIDARNRVVKQGDLETNSVAMARIVYGYEADSVNSAPVSMPPSMPMRDQVKSLQVLPDAVIREGFIELDRKWVEVNLPDEEVLDACAHVFGTRRSAG